MEIIEVGNGVADITQVWDVFLFPIISTILVVLFVWKLYGKEFYKKIFEKYTVIKEDGKYYRKKYIKVNNRERYIFVPLSDFESRCISYLKRPITLFVICLIAMYSLYRLILFCSSIYPITYYFRGTEMMLRYVPKGTLATIWSYFPEYGIIDLYHKIDIMGKDCPYVQWNDVKEMLFLLHLAEFFSVLSILKLVFKKDKIGDKLKTLLYVLGCLICVCGFNFMIFQEDAKEFEQKAYYVEEQLRLEQATVDYDAFEVAYLNIEREISYVDYKWNYGSFGITFNFDIENIQLYIKEHKENIYILYENIYKAINKTVRNLIG